MRNNEKTPVEAGVDAEMCGALLCDIPHNPIVSRPGPGVKTPVELAQLAIWHPWRATPRPGGGTGKPPVSRAGRLAKKDDQAMTLSEALAVMERFNLDGVGLVLPPGYVAVDLDDVLGSGEEFHPAVAHILPLFAGAALAEWSPSGNGIHIITRGQWPGDKTVYYLDGQKFEIFAGNAETRHFLTVTGNILGEAYGAIGEGQEALNELHRLLTASEADRAARAPRKAPEPGRKTIRSNGHHPPVVASELPLTMADVRAALDALASWRADDYWEWLKVGTSVKSALGGDGFPLWLDWSRQSSKFENEADCARHWFTFDVGRVGPGTLIALAREDRPGWISPSLRRALAEKGKSIQGGKGPRAAAEGRVASAGGDNLSGGGGLASAGQHGIYTPLSLDEVMTYFRLEEEGDAQLFARLNAGEAIYDPIDGAWFVWDGHYWKPDQSGHITGLFAPVAAQFKFAEAELTKRGADGDAVKALAKRARALRFKNRMNNVLFLARKYLEMDPMKWDNAPYKLAVANGVVNLRTGQLEPGDPSDFIRSAAPIEWRGLDASAPLWEKMVRDIFLGDRELIAYFQRLMGVAVSGISPAREFPIWYGEHGGNGKSTLLEIFGEVLGPDLAGGVPQEVAVKFQRRSEGSHTAHLVALRGKRLAWVDEIEERDRVNVATVQMVTGGGPITARAAYASKSVTFRPTHLFLLSTNFRPKAESAYQSLWDRIRLLPFEARFVDDPKEGEFKKDPELKGKIIASELPGVLAWAVRGFIDFLDRGQRLDPPDKVKMATEAYRRENDTLARFLEEVCILEEGARVRASELRNAYKIWCEDEGEKPVSPQEFGKLLKAQFDFVLSKNRVVYLGIGLPTGEDLSLTHP